MSTNNRNIANLAAEFMGQFNGRHIILFAGRKTTEEDLKAVASLSWSCIVTTRTDDSFGDAFTGDERRPKEYLNFKDVPVRPLCKQGDLPILRLCGMGEQLDEEIIEELAIIGMTPEEHKLEKTKEMFRLVSTLLDGSNIMVVIGFSPDEEGEIPYALFASVLSRNVAGGKVQFWGLDESNDKVKMLRTLSERKGYAWYEHTLREIVDFWRISEKSDEFPQPEVSEDDEIFYKGGQSVGISPKVLLQYRHFATLLTEQTITAVRPYGKIQQARWYYNFLTLSASEGPQWYGYLRNSEFYLRRDFEDTLVNLVRKQIAGNDPADNGPGSPIILFGEPCSSKSITLAALAYRVFNEHLNPVIYIKNDTLLFSNDSSETVELLKMMEAIDKIGKDMRILLIWDCSSYRNVATNIKRLSKILSDVGRRFVLVCSAYDDPVHTEETRKYFRYSHNEQTIQYQPSTIQQYDLYFSNGCYYVPATRELSDRERIHLWQKFTEFSGTPKDRLKWFKTQIEPDANIFQYFYRIIALLRPSLERSLTREERKVNQYVTETLNRIYPKLGTQTQSGGSVASAFLAAGIDLSAYGIDADSLEASLDADEDKSEYDLHRFNTCIAMFSRFKIEVPYSLAMQMLKPRNQSLTDFSVNYDPELFDLMTKQIPWLRYGESKSGEDYAFSFRNALEAELYLDRNNVSGQEQVEILCEMLEMYGAFYKENRYLLDPVLGDNLQHLIRLMGPNSQYPPFQGEKKLVHDDILRNIRPVIAALQSLCDDAQIPDSDAGFSTILVTLTREYYGGKWEKLYDPGKCPDLYIPEKYLERMEQLYEAIQFAIEKIEGLEIAVKDTRQVAVRKHLTDQRNALTVELVLCNTILQRLQKEYQDVCKDQGITDIEDREYHAGLGYRELYNRLYKVILSNPSNGHAYNALFSAFEQMYRNSPLSRQQKLQYLSEIKLIADDCGSIDIQSRGADERDEISDHLQNIAQISSNYRVTIDDIRNHRVDSTFSELYENMREANSPSAVTFVCQQELSQAKIDHNTELLSSYQISVCRKIMEFMREEQNSTCIAGNYYALNLLLRVTWMCYTGRAMKDSPECQLITMSHEKWKDISDISDACINATMQHPGTPAKPLVVLINALAILQAEGDYNECIRRVRSINEDQFYFAPRMKVPFIVCDENGPMLHNGIVLDTDNYNGFIKLSDVDLDKRGVRFHLRNLNPDTKMPSKFERLKDLELGLGYTGFSVYTKAGRERRVAQS